MTRRAAFVSVAALLIWGLRSDVRTDAALAGGYPVDHCGWIERRGDCFVFASLNGKYREHVIEAGAVPDSVHDFLGHVVGSADACSVECRNYMYTRCIVDFEITDCTPIDLGCGVLEGPYKEADCWLWKSAEYGSVLTGSHGYAAGDTVHVVGLIDPYCATICGIGDGCLMVWSHSACGDTSTVVDDVSWGEIKHRFQP
ncbi:MAG: hypothetical protein IPK72_24565 [Candidatus Eisenbacteria bacterium]|nr:hypothetical protein [Candidatus Eisenbacteria bacterium]